MVAKDEEYKTIENFLPLSGAKVLNSKQFSEFMDKRDPLGKFRKNFFIPKVKNISNIENLEKEQGDKDCIYLTGNSLGLQCKQSKEMVEAALKSWAEIGVEGWFHNESGNLPWVDLENLEQPQTNMENALAKVVGAKPIEVGVGGTLTSNLNSLMLSFYKPTPQRYKILIEGNAFPSDRYAVEGQILLNGLTVKDSLILMNSREGEYCLRTEDILETIEKEGHQIALIMFSGIQYYTGQFFQMKQITEAGHAKGCVVGWDLAHAAGNVPLRLHDWNVDFAVWCSYKYLNAGPGAIGCLFLHEKYAYKKFEGRLAGWWAADVADRFKMEDVFLPRPGAQGFIPSTMNILSLSSFLGSLQVFSQTSMAELRSKSVLLTTYLESLLKSEIEESMLSIMTPSDPNQRGAQLSLIIHGQPLEVVYQQFINFGVVCDKRNPVCLRVAPVPLYTTFEDVRRFVQILKNILGTQIPNGLNQNGVKVEN